MLNVLESDIAQGTKIKDESTVASGDSRNCANLHGRCSHLFATCRSLDRKGVFPIGQRVSVRVLAIPREIEATGLLGAKILGLNHLAGSILDRQFHRVGRALKQRTADGLTIGKRQDIAGHHDIFADDSCRLQALRFVVAGQELG